MSTGEWINLGTLLVAIVSVWFAFRATRRSYRDSINEKFEIINEKFEAIRASISDLRQGITSIEAWLQGRFRRTPFFTKSPLKLTDFGIDLSKNLDANKWALNAAKFLFDLSKGKKEYEVHELCLEYVKDKLDTLMQEEVKRVSYESGISKKDVRIVLAIVLRDKLLENHPAAPTPD